MSSVATPQPDSADSDLTTKARIRDAAIECIAAHGTADTTARKVAAAAGVSPGLVIHHFGSMDNLRAACDKHLVAVIRQEKERALTSATGFDVVSALRNSQTGSLTGYLAQVLVDGSPIVDELVDGLVADATQYLAKGVQSGMLRPTSDEQGRAAVLTIWSLGTLVLHRHVKRLFGVDPTDPGFAADLAGLPLMTVTAQILSEGVYSESLSDQLRTAFSTQQPAHPREETDD